MDQVKISSVVVAKSEPLAAPLAEGTVILQVDTDRYYNLNEVSTYVWEMVQQPVTVVEIIDRITSTYDVDSERCEADVVALLHNMARAQLITVHGEARNQSRT
jgi:hypothetical protein